MAKCPICSSELVHSSSYLLACPNNEKTHGEYFAFYVNKTINTETFWLEEYAVSNDYQQKQYFIYAYNSKDTEASREKKIGKMLLKGDGHLSYSPTMVDFIKNMLVLE